MGDKVILKIDLVIGKVYGDLTLYPEMAKFNEVFTIDTIVDDPKYCHYGVRESGYFFAEEMLEFYTTSNTSKKYDAPLIDAETSKSNIESIRKDLDNVDCNTLFDWPTIRTYGKSFSVYDILNDINNQEKSVLSDDKTLILQIHKNKSKLKFNFN